MIQLVNSAEAQEINSSLLSIVKELEKNYYTINDVFTITTPENEASFVAGGLLTNSSTEIKFIVVLPKTLSNVTKVTVQELKTNIRNTSGSYTPNSSFIKNGYDLVSDKTVSIQTSILTPNTIGIKLKKNSFSGTNNTPVSVEINKLSIQFK